MTPGLRSLAYLVQDQEVSHFVLFVPVGWGRRLQRIEGKSLILVLVVSIPTAPTSFLIHLTGLVKSARQQKAALTSKTGSADGKCLRHGWHADTL